MKRLRYGFTLVELLVVIAIIAILVLMLLPAISAMRESARRTQCMNRMSQLIMGVHSHEMSHGFYPTGVKNPSGPIVSQEQGFHHSWTIPLLPFIEEDNVYRMIAHDQSVYSKNNRPVRDTHLAIFLCPSSPSLVDVIGHSNYAAVHHDLEAPINDDNRGVFFLNSHLNQDDVTDGTRYTLFLGEKILERGDLGWMSGTRATLRNAGTPMNLTDPQAKGQMGLSQAYLDQYESVDYTEVPLEPRGDVAVEQEVTDEDALSEEEASDDDQTTVLEDGEVQDDEVAPTEEPIAGSEQAEIEGDEADKGATEDTSSNDDSTDQLVNDPWAAAKKAGLYVGGFGSFHPGGSMFAFGDGHVRFIDNGINFQVYQYMAGRADGKVIDGRVLD